MGPSTFPFVSQVRPQAREQGRVEALAAAVLQVLDGRGIPVNQDSRRRIVSCRDADVLSTWLDRAVVVPNAADLFA